MLNTRKSGRGSIVEGAIRAVICRKRIRHRERDPYEKQDDCARDDQAPARLA
jgi:hypothetical protein